MIWRRRGYVRNLRRYEEGGTVQPQAPEESPAASENATSEETPEPRPRKVEDAREDVADKREDVADKREDVAAEDVADPEETALNKILNKLFGYIPQSVARWLKAHGDKPITALTLKRTPVSGAITKVMDLASLGGLSAAQKRLGYDKLWHLYLQMDLKGGPSAATEKNETMKINPARADTKFTESQAVPLRGDLTPNDLFTAALKKYGDKKLTVYDPFRQGLNCQGYVSMLLSASGLLTTAARRFIQQDAPAIARSLPGFIPRKAKKVTDVAATINKLLEVISGGRLSLEDGGVVP